MPVHYSYAPCDTCAPCSCTYGSCALFPLYIRYLCTVCLYIRCLCTIFFCTYDASALCSCVSCYTITPCTCTSSTHAPCSSNCTACALCPCVYVAPAHCTLLYNYSCTALYLYPSLFSVCMCTHMCCFRSLLGAAHVPGALPCTIFFVLLTHTLSSMCRACA